jgi:hypothetical protein
VPAELIQALEEADVDPAAKRHAEVVEMAQQGRAAGLSDDEAVKVAKNAKAAEAKAVRTARDARTAAVWKGGRQFTREQKWTLNAFERQVEGVDKDKVPPDRKADVLVAGLAVALWFVGSRQPITVRPVPTIDLAAGKAPEAVAADDEGERGGEIDDDEIGSLELQNRAGGCERQLGEVAGH